MLRVSSIALMFCLAVSGCSSSEEESDGPASFDVSSYDKSCAANSDCVRVYSGDPCGCDCAVAAIASSEQARYQADADAYRTRTCPDGALVCGPCPPAPTVSCVDGQCAVAP
jgi:hypothetical protein